MEIIEHGKTYKKMVCDICNCIFYYTQIDITREIYRECIPTVQVIIKNFIKCPECGKELGLEE